MIFLDTDIISYHFGADTKIKDKLFKAMQQNEKVCVTVINIYEILKGLKWRSNHQIETKIKNFLNSLSVYSIDIDVIDIASNIYSTLRKKGKPIGDGDILIAAIVIKNNGTLITNNTKHFENIEQLKLENWM